MKTKINKIIRRIAVFFAVFFAAGLFNISANAQYVSEATARVYRPMGTLPVHLVPIGNPTMVDFNQAVADIITDIPDSPLLGTVTERLFLIVIGTNMHFADSIDAATGLPDFAGNGGLLDFGQTVIFDETNFGPDSTQITTRIYRGADGRHYMAAGEGTELPAPAVAPENVSMVIGDEFFILGDTGDANAWTATNAISRDAIEFMPAVCADGFVSDDDIICRAIAAADCTGATPAFANGVCVDVCPNNIPDFDTDGKTCIAATTPTLTCDAESTTGQNGDECTCRDGYTQRISPEMCAMPQTGNNNPSTGNNTQTSGGESESKAAKVIGVVGIGMAIFVIANGGLFSDAFAFSPDFGYSLTESGYAINGGGKISYSAENLQMHWSANQTNTGGEFGDFRYLSKAEYKTDLFAATFSESVSGETADYNFSLSANLQNGIWKISPVYRLHSEYDKGETETQNTLNLEGILRYNGWTISPSAGFRWENADGFADNARFRINAIHRF